MSCPAILHLEFGRAFLWVVRHCALGPFSRRGGSRLRAKKPSWVAYPFAVLFERVGRSARSLSRFASAGFLAVTRKISIFTAETFTYDASGNATGDSTYTYAWNGESQLESAAGVTYLYDGHGRRVSKSNGKLYWYGPSGEIIAETDATGHKLNDYIFFAGKHIGTQASSGVGAFYVEDSLGSSRVLSTTTGAVCYDADFTPYGGERAYTNTCRKIRTRTKPNRISRRRLANNQPRNSQRLRPKAESIRTTNSQPVTSS
jgi:hypothetical protein